MKSKKKRSSILIKSFIIVLLVVLMNLIFDQNLSISNLIHLYPSSPQVGDTKGETFSFHLLPPWGTLSLDGQQLQQVPLNGEVQALQLPPGKHILTWKSEQFQPVQCTVFVPVHSDADKTQTCRVKKQTTPSGAFPRYELSFPVSPSLMLVQKQLQQPLVQAIQKYLNTLSATETVQSGEQYRYNSQTPINTAHQPLQAQLHFLLDTNIKGPANCVSPYLGPNCTNADVGGDCRLICTINWVSSRTLDQQASWTVAVITRPTWEYSVVGGPQDSHAGSQEYLGDQQYTTLSITWKDHAWHVASHAQGVSDFDDPNCISTIGKLNFNLQLPAAGTEHITNWSFISGQNRAMGCLVKVDLQTASDNTQEKATSRSVYYLNRFGLLMAVDNAAHMLAPQWPITKANVKHILPAILNKPAFISG
jgi:hypothetical protein